MRAVSSLVKTDCILYDKANGYCKGLKCLFCADTRYCPFYKSNKKYNEDGTKRAEVERNGKVK